LFDCIQGVAEARPDVQFVLWEVGWERLKWPGGHDRVPRFFINGFGPRRTKQLDHLDLAAALQNEEQQQLALESLRHRCRRIPPYPFNSIFSIFDMGKVCEILDIFDVEREDGIDPTELLRVPMPMR
jgi:hypothetical protein